MGGENDPYSDAYFPRTDPGSSLDGAGQYGGSFVSDLRWLYEMGRYHLPETAGLLADVAAGLARGWNDVGCYGASLLHAAFDELQGALAETREAAALTSKHCHLAGEALVVIADRYVRTDEEVATEFNRLFEPGKLDDPPPYAPPRPLSELPGHPANLGRDPGMPLRPGVPLMPGTSADRTQEAS